MSSQGLRVGCWGGSDLLSWVTCHDTIQNQRQWFMSPLSFTPPIIWLSRIVTCLFDQQNINTWYLFSHTTFFLKSPVITAMGNCRPRSLSWMDKHGGSVFMWRPTAFSIDTSSLPKTRAQKSNTKLWLFKTPFLPKVIFTYLNHTVVFN